MAGAFLWQASAHAQIHRAGLIVQHGSSWPGRHLVVRCIEFAQEAISGLSLLEIAGVNSGQPPQLYDWGGGADTICQIDREPTVIPAHCFGPTTGPNWSDWTRTPAGWAARPTGATGYTLHDGEMEAWTYTTGFGAPPPAISFTAACPTSQPPSAPNAAHPAAAPTQPSLATTPVPTASVAASSATATPVEALIPSATATSRQALAQTGPSPPPTDAHASSPLLLWLLAGGGGAMLLGLAAVNLWRRS